MKALKIFLATFLILAAALFTLGYSLLPPELEAPAAGEWGLYDVTLIQPGEYVKEHQDILIRGGRIQEIRESRPGERGVDPTRTGGYVIPGLIDLHVHYPPTLAVGQQALWSLLFLAHGVTGVRDIGDVDNSIEAVRKEIRGGWMIGPAITHCGPILDGSPPSFPSNFVVATPGAARQKVRELKAKGVDCIKVYTMLKKDVLRAIQASAKELGLPVNGHLPHSVSLAESGLKEIQHFMGIPEVDKIRVGLDEFSLSDWNKLDEARMNRQIKIAKKLGIEFLPTVFNSYQREMILDDSAWETDSGLKHLPDFWRGAWRTLWGAPYKNAAEKKMRQKWYADSIKLIQKMHAAGVTVHLGTDTLMPYVAPGSSLLGEMAIFIRAGLSKEEVLYRVTTHAGTHMAPPTGRLEKGYPADLLLLDTNPLENFDALNNPRYVAAAGRLYHRDTLKKNLAVYDRHFLEGRYPAVMGVLVRGIQKLFQR